jgi:Uma2 family endonuclease
MATSHRYVDGMGHALITAEELLHLNLPNKRTELVRGVLVVREPAGYQHGAVAMRIALTLGRFLDEHPLGELVAAETGFVLERGPDTVRAPDVGFIRRDRVPSPAPRGYADFAPDLAVEVLSPDDRPGEVLAKVGDWLKSGVRLVWIVDPIRRLARVYRADGSEAALGEADTLDGEDVLPGYRGRLAAFF